MLNAIHLYGRMAATSIRGQMQYRASFIMQTLGQVGLVIEFVAIWALFHRFGNLGGWTLAEVAMLYGIVHVQWGITDLLGRAFDSFGNNVRKGDFDRILLRPRSTVLQLAGTEILLHRIGRIFQGAAVLTWALAQLDMAWTPVKVALFLTTLLAGTALFGGMLIMQATLCFWTIEGLEVANIFTHGGVETARYPMAIYPRWFRSLFTIVVPLGAVTYFPAMALLGRDDPLGSPVWFQWTAPLLGFLFFGVSLQVWKLGLRRYRSTGS